MGRGSTKYLGVVQCTVCGTICLGRRLGQRRAEECPGQNPALLEVVRFPKGHVLSLAVCKGSPTLICTSCGAWSSRQLRLLRNPCPRRPAAAGKLVLARVEQGLHPHHRVAEPLDDFVRLADL